MLSWIRGVGHRRPINLDGGMALYVNIYVSMRKIENNNRNVKPCDKFLSKRKKSKVLPIVP